MLSQSLVSVIIIFLNCEQFIEEAITSIFVQTYTNWELLLVDDGSIDKSTIIAKEYARKHPEKVRYFEHENHQNCGMSASRNLGIIHANGDYIGFLDADDIWLPQKLEQQIAILNSYPEAAMVYGRTQIWYSWNGNNQDCQQDHFYELGVEPNTLVKPPQLFLLLLQNKCQTPTTCNALVRRDVFQQIGRFEESFRTMYEDQAFFSKVLLNADVFVADEYWARYRQHSNSCTSADETQKYYINRLPFLDWLGNYLEEKQIQNQKIWLAYKWEVWQCHYPFLASILIWIQYKLSYAKKLLSFNLNVKQ